METDLRCNSLRCRKQLSLEGRAVTTTCSHIFCVECANVLFNDSQTCPACEATLTEPDDIVLCALNPTNDYKTSVLAGLSPNIILEVCTRSISFWQYQMSQESTFQQMLLKNTQERLAVLEKQVHNIVREANGEINILQNKLASVELELELERRKVRDLAEAQREREREYTKLKASHDKLKRRALLALGSGDPPTPRPGHGPAGAHNVGPKAFGQPRGSMGGSTSSQEGIHHQAHQAFQPTQQRQGISAPAAATNIYAQQQQAQQQQQARKQQQQQQQQQGRPAGAFAGTPSRGGGRNAATVATPRGPFRPASLSGGL